MRDTRRPQKQRLVTQVKIRFLITSSVALLLMGNLAEAQTLNQQISRGATFYTPTPDFQGWAAIQNAQTQAMQAAAQRRLIEEQTRSLQLENSRREEQARVTQNPNHSGVAAPHMQQWLRSAQPRMHLFPNFDQIVFTQDLAITDDMIRIMAGSQYAADIAYYLGTHKMEAVAISRMTILDAARSISDIEKRITILAKKTD